LAALLGVLEYDENADEALGEVEVAEGSTSHGWLVGYISSLSLRPAKKGSVRACLNMLLTVLKSHLFGNSMMYATKLLMPMVNHLSYNLLMQFIFPGLVRKQGCLHIQDSADSVAIMINDDGNLSAVPIEVKSRCSPRTYHRE
jgi:hypothetical protein